MAHYCDQKLGVAGKMGAKTSELVDENGNNQQVTGDAVNEANNNNNSQDHNNSMAKSIKRPCQGPTVKTRPALQRQDECEDWQLIDGAEVADSSKTKFVEIEPPLDTSDSHTASMIYVCTLIYSLMPLASMLTTLALLCLLASQYYYITLAYYGYVFMFRNICNRGGQRLAFVYEAKFWSYLAGYFPIKLRFSQTFNLKPQENYILNYSPHGISAFGSVVSFATNGLQFSKLFPGITARFMVHETSFMVPVMRETFLFRGDCSVNSTSIDHLLSQRQRGNLLTIVVGGLAEADLSDPQVLKVVVAHRKGFIKKALVHKAHIIPCIAFGENSAFTKVTHEPNSLMHKLETSWYKMFQFKHPLYYGQSALSDKRRGVMPYKRPITVVMGNPIEVAERVAKPSQADIDSLHERYLLELKSLYDSNQDLCAKYDTKLELV